MALYCPPKMEGGEGTRSVCGKESDKSHRNKCNLSLATLTLSFICHVNRADTCSKPGDISTHKQELRSCCFSLSYLSVCVIVCVLAGLLAGVQCLGLFQDWSSQANTAQLLHNPSFNPSHSFSIIPFTRAISFFSSISSAKLSLSSSLLILLVGVLPRLRSQWVGQWH